MRQDEDPEKRPHPSNAECQPPLPLGLRLHQIFQALHLSEIQATAFERATGELAWFRGPAGGEAGEGCECAGDDSASGVEVEFEGVLGRE